MAAEMHWAISLSKVLQSRTWRARTFRLVMDACDATKEDAVCAS